MEKTELIKNKLNADNQFVVPPMLLRTLEAGGFLRANVSFLTMVGFSEAELAEEPFLYWIDPNDEKVASLTIDGKQTSCQINHRTKDGEHLPLQIRVVENGGESFVLAHSLKDVELINAPGDSEDEASIRGTLHTIANIIEEQNPGYLCSILLVADGRFVRGAGPSLPEEYNAAIDGYAIGPTVGSCGTAIYWNIPVIVDDIQADPLWVPFAELAKKAGVASCWSYPFSSTTGNVLGALALYSPVPRMPNKEQFGHLKVAARITGLAVERARAEKALRVQHKRKLELEEQLQHANKMESIGNLAGGIAHEFNNILTIIIGNNELVRNELPEGSLARENTEEIRIAGMRAREVVKQLLTFSRKDNAAKKILNIRSVVQESMKLVRSSTPAYIEIRQNLSDDVYPVFGNATQINQLLFNLCSNAVDAMSKSGGVIAIDLSNETAGEKQHLSLNPGQYVKLVVRDNGIGMVKEILDKVFDPYFTTKEIGKGTGIGLAVVHGIVKQHGGSIIAESHPYQGTTFTIFLPIHEGLTENDSDGQQTDLPTGNERILYVDDELSIAKLGKRNLESLGYIVESTTNPLQALEMVTTNPDKFDLVITDMAMPKMAGDQLITEVLKFRPTMPTIICTGYSVNISKKNVEKFGAAAFVMKPLDKAELAQTIRKVLDGAKG